MLHVDIPTLPELKKLAATRGDICASIFVPTTPLTQETAADRITLKNLTQSLIGELEAKGFDKRRIIALEEQLADLVDDDEFWRFQARSLAVLATPDSVRCYRLPNQLKEAVEVADRFHLKPIRRFFCGNMRVGSTALSEVFLRAVRRLCSLPRSSRSIRSFARSIPIRISLMSKIAFG